MTYLLIALALVGGFYLFLWIADLVPLKHRNLTQQRLYRLVEALYFRGFSNGTMTIRVAGRRGAELTVQKNIVKDDHVLLSVDVTDPLVVSPAQELSGELGIAAGLSGTPSYSTTHRGIRVDFGNDLRLCEQFLRRFAERAWNVDLQRDGYAVLKNVAAGNYRIGWSK